MVNTAPPTPTLLTPVNNAGQSDTTPTFTWSPVVDAEGDAVTYEIQVDNNSDFSSPVVLSPTATALSTATYTPTTTLTAGTTYFWRVRSSDGIVSSAYSTSRTLFIVAPGNWQLFPLTTSVRQSQAFTWQVTATNTTSGSSPLYCIRIAIPSANFTGISAVINSASGHTGWVTSATTSAGTTTLQINTPTSGQNLAQNESLVFTVSATSTAATGAIAWPASGLTTTGCGTQFSANPTQTVTVVANTAPTVPALTAPADSAQLTTGTPVFTWAASTDANGDTVSYQIQIDDNNDFSSPAVSQSGLSVTSFTPGSALPNGTYFWRVRASDDLTSSAYSTVRTFSIDTQPPTVLSIDAVDASPTNALKSPGSSRSAKP